MHFQGWMTAEYSVKRALLWGVGLIAAMLVWGFSAFHGPVFAASYTDFPYAGDIGGTTTDIAEVLKQGNTQGTRLEQYLDLFGINYADQGSGKAIAYVQVLLNYLLGILGLFTTLLFIYSFYMIFFGKSEDQIANARKTITGAAIALVVIGLSAYIVNFLFYIYNKGIS